ncbi:MAG: 2-amino-4-hydroxy-6-hydroxymethyldihydropteridine diphosphokinase [Planctomycetaceae bacterium]
MAADPVRSLISFGSNTGASADLADRVIGELASAGLEIRSVSRLKQTSAVGINAGDSFLNAALTGDWSGTAQQLLNVLQQTENRFGRQRTIRWGPRTVDLDLLLFDGMTLVEPGLILPHPALWYRDFVLAPSAEVASDMWHPVLQQTIGQLHQRLLQRPLSLHADSSALCAKLRTQIASRLPERNEVLWRSQSEEDLFATIRMRTASVQQPPLSYPEETAAGPEIILFVESAADAILQIEQLLVAMIG